MALTVTTDLSDIDLAESATPWTIGSLDPDKYVQGSNSIGWYAGKNARTVNGVSSKSIAHSAGDHLYFWMASDVISKAEAKTTGTTTASGLTCRVTLSDGAYREWHVAGSDTWDGGWKCFVIDLAHTGTQLYASSGTWSTANNITDVDFYVDLSNSGNIRNVPANHYNDAIRVGTGITAYNTSAADPAFDFADIAAIADATSQKYGILFPQTDGGDALGCQGHVTIGDTGTNHLDFDSQSELVEFLERNGTGDGFVATALYGITVVANATGSDQDFNMGVKVGTGDTMSGRNGTTIRAAGTATWDFTSQDADLHNFSMYGCTIAGADSTTTGVLIDGPTTTGEIAQTTFDGCSQVQIDDVTTRNCFWLNTTAAATSGALLWENGTTDVKNSNFVNNAVGIEMQTLAANVSFTGMEFSGNTNDVRFEGTGTWDLNWTAASGAPSIQNAGAGTLTAKNTVTLTLTNVVIGSQCSVHTDPGGTELMNEAATSTTVTEPYEFTADQAVIIRVRKSSADPKYKNFAAKATVTSSGLTRRIDQVPVEV